MVIDEETRRTIIELYSSQHKTIRQITKITRKSSRDITAILKERNRKSRTQAYEVDEKIQNIAQDKVSSFLTGYNGMKLLEFALLSVCEVLRNDPQKELLIEKTPPIKNCDFNSSSVELEQPPFPNPYDDSPHFAREKVLELSNKYYNRLVKGLTDCSISTAAVIGTN